MSEEHFRKVYDSDEKNKALQSWDVYWKSVQAEKAKWDKLLVDSVTKLQLKPKARVQVMTRIQAFGVRALGEAAKQAGVRAYSWSDLQNHMNAIISTASGDSGNGEVMIPTLEHVEGMLNKAIEDRGLPLL